MTSLGFSDNRVRGKMPPRLMYISKATNGASGEVLPAVANARSENQGGLIELERPQQYAELEELLKNVSQRFRTEHKHAWIPSSSTLRVSWPRPRAHAESRPSSRDGTATKGPEALYGGLESTNQEGRTKAHTRSATANPLTAYLPSEEALQHLPSRTMPSRIDRSHSFNDNMRAAHDKRHAVLPPLYKKKTTLDDLDLLFSRDSERNPPPALSAKDSVDISSVPSDSLSALEQTAVESPDAKEVEEKKDKDPLEAILPSNSLSTRHRLSRYARGEVGDATPKCVFIPEVKDHVWELENQRSKKLHAAAVHMQSTWRKYIRQKKYRRYVIGRMSKRIALYKAILQIWLRVARQREHEHLPGSNVRGTMSYWLIAWRVELSKNHIARDKARDLQDIWQTMLGRYVMHCWSRCAGVMGFERHRCMYHGFEPWKALWNDALIVKKSASKHSHKFLYAAFRCLYFYTRCCTKARLRAHRLFRVHEQSISEFCMPIQRFPGYYNLFKPHLILCKFQDQDWYERRVYRAWYIRLIPQIFRAWTALFRKCQKCNFVIQLYERQLKGKAFSVFCFLMETNEFGERIHHLVELEMEEERLAQEGKVDQERDHLKELESDIDNLAGLVDYERREVMRKIVQDRKRKTLHAINHELVMRDQRYVEELDNVISADMKAFDEISKKLVDNEQLRKQEQERLMDDLKHHEATQWKEKVQQVRDLFARACDILGKVLDDATRERDTKVFRTVWGNLRKAAFKVRMRRVLNRAHVRRLLHICARHRQLERSIYKYRPLRLKLYALLRWFKLIEYQYTHTTKALKGHVRRRQDLYMKLSDCLRAYCDRQVFMRLPSLQVYYSLDFILARWCEYTQSVVSRREFIRLFRKRRGVVLLSRSFDYLKHRVRWRERMDGPEGVPERFFERQASCDLLVWKKDYFSGVSYAKILRWAERRGKKKSLEVIHRGPRLVGRLEIRKKEIHERIVNEQRLLMRYFEEVDADEGQGSGLTKFEAFPAMHWGTVLNMRYNELQLLLARCDKLARAGKREFDSINIGFAISSWFFKIRCNMLPKIDAKHLPSSKGYWIHIRSLFTTAKHSQVAKDIIRKEKNQKTEE
jgi:hypothetical protein